MVLSHVCCKQATWVDSGVCNTLVQRLPFVQISVELRLPRSLRSPLHKRVLLLILCIHTVASQKRHVRNIYVLHRLCMDLQKYEQKSAL